MKHTKVIIDGMNMIYTSHYGAGELRTEKTDRPSGTLYVVISKILNIIETHDPVEIIVAWETGDSWRFKTYKDYKSKRRNKELTEEEIEKKRELLEIEIPDVKKFLANIGIRQLIVPLLEADDIIGHIVTRAEEENSKYIIYSSDRDLFQHCKRNCCEVINFVTGVRTFESREGHLKDSKGTFLGQSPRTYALMKAIEGDTSDCITGIMGVGHKTLLNYFDKPFKSKQSITDYLNQYDYDQKKWRSIIDNVELVSKNFILIEFGNQFYRKKIKENKIANKFMKATLYDPRTPNAEHLKLPNWVKAGRKTMIGSALHRMFIKFEFDSFTNNTAMLNYNNQLIQLNKRANRFKKEIWRLPHGPWDMETKQHEQ